MSCAYCLPFIGLEWTFDAFSDWSKAAQRVAQVPSRYFRSDAWFVRQRPYSRRGNRLAGGRLPNHRAPRRLRVV